MKETKQFIKQEFWWEDLNNYIDKCRGKSIDWNTFDCCQFICGAVEAMSGVDPYPLFGYKYNTKTMAMQVVKKFASTKSYNQGIKYIVRNIGEQIGGIKVDRPKRGDIVVINTDIGEYICGCYLNGNVAVIDEHKGLQFIPAALCDFKLIMRIPEWVL